MEQNKIDMFISANMEKFPVEKTILIKEQLEKMSDDKFLMVQTTQYKDPTTMLILSIFLGSWGLDRFILGDTTMGVLKLLTCGGCGIWTIIDWFSVQDRTKQWNFRKLMQTIDPSNPMAYMA